MKMKKILLLLICAALILCLCSCGRSRCIRVTGGEDLVLSCPKRARAGETVTVETKTVTDGWLEVTVNGTEAEAMQGDRFQFVMPEEDADVKVLFTWE